MATANRTRLAAPRINLKPLAATAVFIAVQVWFLATQTWSVLLPMLWLAPMDLFLLVYALDDTLELVEVVMMLFFGRFLLFPVIVFSPMHSFPLFYGLFMAPVDVMFGIYVLRAAGTSMFSSATA